MNPVIPHTLGKCKVDVFQTLYPAPLPETAKTLVFILPFLPPKNMPNFN
jgi:hypothetical protein